MGYRKRVDANQPEIVAALRMAGYSVWHTHTLGGGFPDLVVSCHAGVNVLVEIKNGKAKLNDLEQKFFNEWPGSKCAVRTAEEAIKTIGGIIDEFNK